MSSSFQSESLVVHNKARAKHGVPPLKLSPQLNQHAQNWAEHLAKTGAFAHSGNKEYGENIAMGAGSGNYDLTAEKVGDMWYSEIKQYDFKKGGFSAGHFTQMVWRGSEEFGVGKAKGDGGKIIVVANYKPPGNMMGQYQENVFPPK